MAADKPLVSVVIPSYNDCAIIRPFYEAVTRTLRGQDRYAYELIYVDDGSEDGSQDVLTDLALRDPRVTYIEFIRNFGQQRALFAGLKASRGDFVVTIDGDYQYEPEAILQVVAALERGHELVSGIRQGRRDRFMDVLSSRIGHALIRYIMGTDIQDFGAIKGFSRGLADKILNREHHFSDVYPSALSLRPAMAEIPVAHRPRPAGRSHWTIWMRIKLWLDLYVEYGDAQFEAPFRLGALICLAGPLFAGVAIPYKFAFGHQASLFQIVVLSLITFMSGLNFMAWAVMMSFLVRIYKQNISTAPYVIRRTVEGSQVAG